MYKKNFFVNDKSYIRISILTFECYKKNLHSNYFRIVKFVLTALMCVYIYVNV